MAVAFVASSRSGQSDVSSASNTCPVPAGAASGHTAVLAIEIYVGDAGSTLLGSGAMTWPSGFTQWGMIGVQNVAQIFVATKTLSAADAGNYVTTWTGTRFHQSMCVLLSDGGSTVAIDANNSKTGTGTSITSMSVTTSGEPGLVTFVCNANAATHTPPTSFTETQEGDYISAAYRIPGASGSQTASGATLSTSSGWAAVLVAVEPAGGPPPPDLTFIRPVYGVSRRFRG